MEKCPFFSLICYMTCYHEDENYECRMGEDIKKEELK
jgi:hypothetical protein